MMECIADKKYVLGKTTQTESHVKGWTVCCLDRVPVLRKQKKMDRHKRGIVVDPLLLFIVLVQTGSEVWSPFRGFKFDLTVLSLIWVNYTEG